jgi:UDP-N-acetylmuramoyl-tripeptide--D-alanyl-D-alanine ligase
MATLSFKEIAKATGGKVAEVDRNNRASSYSMDSRTLQSGELFFAIKGENYDGHHFLSEVFRKGAVGAVVQEGADLNGEGGNKRLIMVKDTHQALKDLAAFVRRRSSIMMAGITGSCGKTTSKDMAYFLLKDHFKTRRTEGNYNNLYGLPFSLLQLNEGDEVFIGEMAMSEAGEIAELAKIAQPNIGVITNIHPVHTEFFPSMKEVAEAKRELLEGLVEERIAVLNADNKLVQEIAGDFDGRRITFGITEEADVMAADIKPLGLDGVAFNLNYQSEKRSVKIDFIGIHNVYNLLAALGICRALELELNMLIEAFSQIKINPMRSRVVKFDGGFALIDDSYNSNPRAMEVVLGYMREVNGYKRKIVVSGDMLELGSIAQSAHTDLGKLIAYSGIDLLCGIGELSRFTVEAAINAGMNAKNVLHFPDAYAVSEYLPPQLQSGDLILVKGSRGIHTDKVVEAIEKYLNKKV